MAASAPRGADGSLDVTIDDLTRALEDEGAGRPCARDGDAGRDDTVRVRLDVLLAESLATVQVMLRADLITIFLRDSRGNQNHLRPLHSTDLPLLWRLRRAADATVDRCLRRCETVCIRDTATFRSFGPKYRPQLDSALGYRTKSVLCVP